MNRRNIPDNGSIALKRLKEGAASATSYVRRAWTRVGKEYVPKLLFRDLALGCAAFLLGGAEIYFSASPFGVAWLCACPVGIPFVVAGLLSAAILRAQEVVMTCCSVLLTVGLRVLVRCVVETPRNGRLRESLFKESAYLRMASAAVCAFAVGFYKMFVGGFYLYDLGGCITSTVVAPLAVAMFMPLFAENDDQLPPRESAAGKILSEAAYFALLFSLSVASVGMEITGLSAVHITVTAAVLYTVRTRGAVRGIGIGIICGAVAGLPFVPVYGLGAALAAMFTELSMLAAATSIPICSALWTLFFSDGAGFITLFPSQVAGLALFCVLSILKERVEFSRLGMQAESVTASFAQSRDRMRELSEAFSGLADSFSELARTRRRPTEGELRSACDKVCDSVCLKCANRNLCWNLEYASTLDIVSKICSAVTAHGYVEVGDLPEYMIKRCPSLDLITEGVNRAATALIRDCLEDGRLSGFSADYRAVSAALAEAVNEDIKENSEDMSRSERVRRVLDGSGVKYSSLSVTGNRRVTVRAENVNLARAKVKAGTLRIMLESAIGCLLGPPTLKPTESGMCLEFVSRRCYSVSFGAARSSAEKGDPCGDSICRIDNGDDYFYAVLCDGMGQGSRAAFASGASVGFLKQMLSAKMSVETSLSVLNAWLRADREECSVSIDILKIDLLTGKASIYKSGAAPSYLRRGRDVFPIESDGFPVGILKHTSAIRTDLDLRFGDVIMMGSDGIDPEGKIAGGDEVWLLDIIESVDVNVPESVTVAAKRTVSSARSAGSRDDIGALFVAVRPEPFDDE